MSEEEPAVVYGVFERVSHSLSLCICNMTVRRNQLPYMVFLCFSMCTISHSLSLYRCSQYSRCGYCFCSVSFHSLMATHSPHVLVFSRASLSRRMATHSPHVLIFSHASLSRLMATHSPHVLVFSRASLLLHPGSLLL